MTGIGTSGHPIEDPLVGPYIAPTGPPVEAAKFPLAKVREDIPTNEEVLKSLARARNLQLKVAGARVISVLGSIGLGAITGAAIAGVLVTPAGWALAGAAVFIGLAGSYYYGGPTEFLKTLLFSVTSFSTVMFPASVIIAKSLCSLAISLAFPLFMVADLSTLVGLSIITKRDNLACRNVSNAIETNDIKLAKQLIGDGSFLNYYSRNPEQLPPLAVAIKHGKTEIIPLLLKAGARIEWGAEWMQAFKPCTALGFALNWAQPDCLKIILQHIQAKRALKPKESEIIKEFLGMPSDKANPQPSRFSELQDRALFMDIVFTLNQEKFFDNCSKAEVGGFYLLIMHEIANLPDSADPRYKNSILTEDGNWMQMWMWMSKTDMFLPALPHAVLKIMKETKRNTVKQCIEFLYKRNASHLESTDEVLAVVKLCRNIGVDLAIQAELGSRYFEIVSNRENGFASISEEERTLFKDLVDFRSMMWI